MTRNEFEKAVDKISLDYPFRRIVNYLKAHDTKQRAEIARLREALVEIVEKCEDEDWEYMFGDILIQAKQALKETTT